MIALAEARLATLIVLATIVAFAAFLTAFRLSARSREGTAEGRTGWTFLAGVAAGSGLWSAHLLLAIAADGDLVFRSGPLVVSYFVAVAGALVCFAFAGGGERRGGAPLVGIMAAATVLAVDLIDLAALSTDRPVVLHGAAMTVTFAGMALLLGTGFALAGRSHRRGSDRDLERAAGALAAALALPISNSLLLGTGGFVGAPVYAAGPDTMGVPAVAAMAAGLMFLAVGTGMATALIDRNGQYVSQRRLRQMQEASVEGIVVVLDNKVVDVNDSFLRITGFAREEVRGLPFVGSLLQVDLSDDRLPQSVLWEGHVAGARGGLVPVEVVARPFDYDGRPHTVFAVRDLSDRRDAELRIRFLAEHDVLTGLPNRASFQRELERGCEAVCAGTGRFALFCLDLDRFKEANDVFGHLAGDHVLLQTASRLRELLGPSAFAARLGGDEFVVMLRDPPSTRVVADVADEIVAVLGRPFLYNGQRIIVGASVGIAVAPADGDTPELVLARADMALYRAKGEGRGLYRFFEQAMDEETRVRRTLAFELRDAIVENQLELYYQPLADVSSNGIVGFEALVRWHHPVHGTISPTVFISIAEESGFISELGEWVLRTACAEAGRWKEKLKIAVNLSPLQLEQPNLPEIVHEALIAGRLAPNRLEIEVTEGSLMRNPQRALDVLRRIKALGVGIAMDDFGTGFSSLSTLQSFPFDKLKIDRSFVDRVGEHAQASSIVRAVLGLSRSLEIRVVAEGVETAAQFHFLAEQSCDEVQGFMIGRPMPIAAYADVVNGETAVPSVERLRA
ncbi:putative bifunctional diguanylate cyclase/phosphodiesterase [Oharaeibacter diazotrophicus]|uniref:Diguanylate cyclase/phosphodiesterase n=1 Tax=Oharaeibacter diazotrophicus TaxID=1920512 RepID=A0A4R6R9X6_9HYPH|nr:EAL domain-containing protein [Oharaeibacter diazotrophicus]TDP82792.1 diguanylate cyclase/phosphodiesterase [Oharaeibacter diazotrophicus]BBE72446.1 phytochrome-like protein cph2 [Pleomorphomonas sp. SM30]GLS76477.1 putative signaling protein [Oharaeibacter diazotrophicus]